MSTEVIYLVKEQRLGVPVSSPTLGEDAIYIKVSEANAFNMTLQKNIGTIPTGNGLNTTGCFYSATNTLTGTLNTELYPDYAKLLSDWAFTQVNSDRDEPWDVAASGVNTFPVNDLASVSIYHGVYYDTSDTWVRRRYSGVKVTGGTISASNQDQIVKMSLNLQGVRDDTNAAGATTLPDETEFPLPDDSDYPCNPYLFTESIVKVNSVIQNYETANLTWTNTINPKYFEKAYPVVLKFRGRGSSTNLVLDMMLTNNPDYEAAYRALTKHDVELSFSKGGTPSIKLDLGTNNIISTRQYDLPLDNVYLFKATINNAIDSVTGKDIVVSST